VPVAVVGVLLAPQPAMRRSAFGFLSGVDVLFVFIAWVHRAGVAVNLAATGAALERSVEH
jgi:hypothetical protein